MKRLSVLLAVSIVTLLIISLVVSCGGPKSEEPVVLRMTLAQPPQDNIPLMCQAAADRFNERVGGTYIMEVYPAEQLCKYAESLDAVRTGAVEMMNIGMGGFAGTLPEVTTGELPFLYESVEANAAAQEGMIALYDQAFQEKVNQKCLASHTVCAMELISKRPVKTLEDWDGLLVACSSVPGTAMVEAFGGSAVFIPFPEVYSAMEKAVVDATLQVPEFTLIAGKLYEVGSYFTSFYALGSVHGATINLDVWNKMPKSTQDILLEEIKAAFATLNEEKAATYYQFIEEIANKGVEVYNLPKAERDKWKDLTRPYVDEQKAALGEIAQKAQQIADEVNSKYPYPY
jgi:TRAP-type C4-dicarboxylate transport system substrate-binding protein